MNLYLKTAVIAALFISVFSFAAVEPWTVLVMQFFIFSSLIAYMLASGGINFTALNKILWIFFTACLLLTVLQCLNEKTIIDAPVWYPVTLSRLYGITEIILIFTMFSAALISANAFDNFKSVKTLCVFFTVCGLGVIAADNIFIKDEYILLFRKSSAAAESFGPFINRNHAGIFLNICFFASLGYFLQALIDKKSIAKYVLCFSVLAVLAFGITSTLSRGAMLAFIVTSILFLFVYALHFFKTRNAKIAMIACLIILSVILFKAVSLNIEAINKFTDRRSGRSEAVRIELYKSAADMLRDYPVFGVGSGSFSLGINHYFFTKVRGYIDRVHNDWLEFVLGFGITGGVMLLISVILIIRRIFRRLNKIEDKKKKIVFLSLSASLFAMCVGSAVDFDFHVPANAFAFFTVFGAVSSETFGWRASFDRRLLIKAAIIIFAFIGMFFYYRYTLSWYNFLIGSSRTYESETAYFERGFYYYPSAPNAEKLAIAYYNAFMLETDELKKTEYFNSLKNHASKSVKRYPASKNLLEFNYISDQHDKHISTTSPSPYPLPDKGEE